MRLRASNNAGSNQKRVNAKRLLSRGEAAVKQGDDGETRATRAVDTTTPGVASRRVERRVATQDPWMLIRETNERQKGRNADVCRVLTPSRPSGRYLPV